MQTRFSKYEGAGNDFVILDLRDGTPSPDKATIARLCDRHFGIGADGLMTLGHPTRPDCDCTMRYYNADGSLGEMCGNGGRCFTLFAHHLGIGDAIVRFDSTDGRHEATVLDAGPYCGHIELSMIDVRKIEQGEGYWFLNTGVPHYVELVNCLDTVPVIERGRKIRYDKRFKEGTNVNFVQVLGAGHIAIRTYERGVENETLACGTGSTAAALAVHFALQPDVHRFRIEARGGELAVTFEQKCPGTYTNIRLSGPARKVFEGTFDTSNFQY